MIAENFNNFFINIGPTLSRKIPFTEGNIEDYLTRIEESIFLKHVDELEVRKTIKHLKDSSSGWDEIDAGMLKLSLDHITVPFTHICNLSLTHGVFPRELKIARVCPIFKGGNPMLFVQYRPVSVLPVMSKVLERIMYDRIYEFLQDLEALYNYQFGFRKMYSTELALMLSIDKIISALDKNNFILGVFLDFSKAFDTIDHNILLCKLDNIGIRGVANKWFSSYLTDRYQYVSHDGENSSRQKIICGVPQGSILGPLLFLIYINDLALMCNNVLPIMYADDSNLFSEGSNISDIQNDINIELEKVSKWLKLNKLSLNVSKTHFMLFKRKRKVVDFSPSLFIDSQPISQVSQTKFLGVYIDEHLTWEAHIDNISSKIAKGIGILRKARPYLNKSTIHQLYYTFVYPYLSYCNIVWGNAYSVYLSKLVKLQKKIVRIIGNTAFRAPTCDLFRNLKILKCPCIYKFQVAQFIYKYSENLLPPLFAYMFTQRSSIHNHNTRGKAQYLPLKFSTALAKRSLRYDGILFWNTLSKDIQKCQSINSFKFNLKRFLIETYN